MERRELEVQEVQAQADVLEGKTAKTDWTRASLSLARIEVEVVFSSMVNPTWQEFCRRLSFQSGLELADLHDSLGGVHRFHFHSCIHSKFGGPGGGGGHSGCGGQWSSRSS